MDLESECSVLESVEDNEEITNCLVSGKLGNVGEAKVQTNGSCLVEDIDKNELFPEVKEKGAEVLGSGNSPCLDLNPEVSPFPIKTRRGQGLKKWRRIKRNVKDGDNINDTGRMVKQNLSNSDVQSSSSKRAQIYAERDEKSEGSVSSTNAVLRKLDGFSLDDSGLGMSPSFATGTDSENSEDRSSRSSTAASAPRIKYEKLVIIGFPHDKSKMRSLSAKNLTHGKGRIEGTKKARGERIKIEKENSHSSVESDLRSTNFVFVQGTYSTNNGIKNGGPKDYDGRNGDEVEGHEQHINDGFRRDGEAVYGDMSPGDVGADSYWEGKGERSNNHGSSEDQDLLTESIFALQSAQEALEKEVVKFKEISKDGSVVDSLSDSETANRDEVEKLFKQKIEAEVEYLTILTTLQNLRVSQITQKQTQILDEAPIIKKETLKLQKKVYNYTLCFMMQFLLLVLVFLLHSSSNYVEVVPT